MRSGWIGGLVVTTGLVLGVACGGDDGGSVAGPSGSLPAVTDGPGVETTTAMPATTAAEELPQADPSTYVGRNRVVHLAVLPDGSTPPVDVWARRSFEYAPILLVEGLEYGEVSDWYGRPEGMSVVVVPAGAGPDAPELASVFSADADQQYTHLVMWDRERNAAAGFLLEDVDPGNTNAFPEVRTGQALVQLFAYQLRLNPLSVGDSFDQTIAGVPTSFQVGLDGIAGCAPQPRLTEQGLSPAVLGGTQRVAFDLAAGTTSFTFHGWGSDDEDCLDPTLFGPLDVTVEANERAWVLLHSRDGETIEALTVPLA